MTTMNRTKTAATDGTSEMIGQPHTNADGSDSEEEQLEMEAKRILEHSPEGRPAHPELKNKNLIWLTVGVVASFLLVSIVVFLFYGIAPAALILVFGTALACLGNPVFWSLPLRAEERREAEQQHS